MILGVILLLALFIVSIWQTRNTKNLPSPTPEPVIISTTTPSPTLASFLQIISIKPAQNLDKVFAPIQQIEIEFNIPIDPASLNYKIDPPTQTNIKFKGSSDKIMVLSPDLMWTRGITTITILKGVATGNNIKMPSDYIYKLNTDFPQVAPPDSPGL